MLLPWWARCVLMAGVASLQHLDSSPNQYIQWRYGIGEDREALEKVNLKVNDDEEKKMAEKQVRQCTTYRPPTELNFQDTPRTHYAASCCHMDSISQQTCFLSNHRFDGWVSPRAWRVPSDTEVEESSVVRQTRLRGSCRNWDWLISRDRYSGHRLSCRCGLC